MAATELPAFTDPSRPAETPPHEAPAPANLATMTDDAFCEAFEKENGEGDHLGAWDNQLTLPRFLDFAYEAVPRLRDEPTANSQISSDGSITGRHRGHMTGLAPRPSDQTRLKEPFSSLSHVVGAILSATALGALMLSAHGRALHLVSFALFGVSLVALFSASALVHSLRAPPTIVARLQRLDYMAIFLLIAGTYAPLCLITLRGAWGWSLLAVEYTTAIGGIVLVATLRRRFPEWVRVALCAVMTWLVLIAVLPLQSALGPAGMGWLLGGIATYTVGTLILITDWPHLRRGRFSAHDLWHIFVLGGSACHFILMIRYVAPAA